MTAAPADASTRPVRATVALAALGIGWYAAHLATGLGPVAVAYVFVPIGMVVAALAVHRLDRAPLAPAARRFWRGVRLGLALLSAGYALLAVDVARHRPGPGDPLPVMPAAVAALLGLGIAVAIWAVLRVPLGEQARADPWRVLLDRAIAFLGSGTALWYVGLAPMLTAPEPWSTRTVLVIGMAFLLATGGVAKMSYVGAGPVAPAAMRLMGANGLIAAAVAILAVGIGDAGAIPAQAVVLPVAPVLIVLAVRAQARGTAATPRGGGLLPYLAIGAVDLPLLAVAGGPLSWTDRVVVVAAVAVTALVAVRQFLSARDNRRLLAERNAQQRLLTHEVTHDALTGLANRAHFHDRLGAALAEGHGATVLLVDLDDFKTVNDSLGHGVGDSLLTAVAAELRAAAGDDGLAARIGGDEFAVLLPGTDAPAEAVAQRMVASLSRPIGPDRLLAQASIGIAAAAAGEPVDTIFRNADVAMYSAKQSGKGGYLRYAPGMEQPVLVHAQLGGELRRGLDRGEFRVAYQPIMDLTEGRLVGLEALARWEHPSRGTVSPAEFVPAAERTGLIVPLGRFVLRETCRQMVAWLAEFGPDAVQKAGVNVSVRQLHDPDFVADVAAVLKETGMPSDRLVLELTESAVLRGRQVSQTLQGLHRIGIRLALDDFGTGESSLSLLRSFPAAIVKLDKSFVDELRGRPADRDARDAQEAVARAVIQLAGALRLDAVAEGIETESQARRLRQLGYTLGQGFHLARPTTAAGVGRLLAAQRAVSAAA